jgi:MoaA/NifB/PqqE/SkfB family radical SAM enzyme
LLGDRLLTVPVLVLMPHSRCNARCLMCDIWKANETKVELSRADLQPHVEEMRRLGVERIIFSGGEALMHENLFALCELLSQLRVRLTLLSTGLTLEKHAPDVGRWFDEVTVSLDGPPAIHDQIRNVPRAYQKLAAGAKAAKAAGVRRVTGRCVVQRQNFRFLEETVEAARDAGLDEISFLPVDVSSEAFNRPGGWTDERTEATALTTDEAFELRDRIESLLASQTLAPRYIAESPAKLRSLAQYFLALRGVTTQRETICNAPWVSAVIEADGAVRPCFFHPPLGSLRTASLRDVLNSDESIRFRRSLDVKRDPICSKCVCTLSVGPRTEV